MPEYDSNKNVTYNTLAMNTFLYYLYGTKAIIVIAEAWIKLSIYCYHQSLDKDTLMLLANI